MRDKIKKSKNKKTINSKSISFLDKKSGLTPDDVNFGARIISRIKNVTKKLFKSDRESR